MYRSTNSLSLRTTSALQSYEAFTWQQCCVWWALMTLSVCRMPLKFFRAGTVSQEIPPAPSKHSVTRCWQPPSSSLPLWHETGPLFGRAVQTVECGEADKVAFFVIIELTDIWETARWIGAVIETPSRRPNGRVCSVYGLRHGLCTCSYEHQTSYWIYFWMCSVPPWKSVLSWKV